MSYRRYIDTYFTTASVFNKVFIFSDQKRSDILLNAFDWLVKNNRCNFLAFVIMSNHFHILWQIHEPYSLGQVRHSLFSYCAKEILKTMTDAERNKFKVDKKDREYQIFKRNPLSIEILHDNILIQKLNYIHDNPRRAGMVEDNEDFSYSSYKSYLTNKKEYDFLTFIW
jgi:REP element-mobilizing transposase RayT